MNARAAPRVTRARCGFGLIEVIIAMLLFTVGMIGSASMIASAASFRSLSASRVDLTALGEDKMEHLRAVARAGTADTVQLVAGGSLSVSIANYADTVASPNGVLFVRRWLVTAGPAQTRDVTVRVVPLVQARVQQPGLNFSTLIAK